MCVNEQINEQREQIDKMAETDPVVHAVFEVKHHNNLTDYEAMIMLAYNAIRLYNSVTKAFNRYMMFDTRNITIQMDGGQDAVKDKR